MVVPEVNMLLLAMVVLIISTHFVNHIYFRHALPVLPQIIEPLPPFPSGQSATAVESNIHTHHLS